MLILLFLHTLFTQHPSFLGIEVVVKKSGGVCQSLLSGLVDLCSLMKGNEYVS